MWLAALIRLSKIVRERDSSSILFPWAVAGFITAFVWTVYGFAADVVRAFLTTPHSRCSRVAGEDCCPCLLSVGVDV
jgi:uncharacterized protein with PQ loop repeat